MFYKIHNTLRMSLVILAVSSLLAGAAEKTSSPDLKKAKERLQVAQAAVDQLNEKWAGIHKELIARDGDIKNLHAEIVRQEREIDARRAELVRRVEALPEMKEILAKREPAEKEKAGAEDWRVKWHRFHHDIVYQDKELNALYLEIVEMDKGLSRQRELFSKRIESLPENRELNQQRKAAYEQLTEQQEKVLLLEKRLVKK